MLRAAEEVDVASRIDGDGRDVRMGEARRELFPADHRFVTERAHASARRVSSTSLAICAESSAGLANAISSRSRFTNAPSTSSP